MNQQELATALTGLATQLNKAKGEINQGISDLNQAIINAGNSTPEVDAALAALTSSVQQLDDLHPDTVVENPTTDPVPGTGGAPVSDGTENSGAGNTGGPAA